MSEEICRPEEMSGESKCVYVCACVCVCVCVCVYVRGGAHVAENLEKFSKCQNWRKLVVQKLCLRFSQTFSQFLTAFILQRNCRPETVSD